MTLPMFTRVFAINGLKIGIITFVILGVSSNDKNPPTQKEMKLLISETIEVQIRAKCKWNSTQVEISEDQEYEFIATGKWTDFTVARDADGYTNTYMELFDAKKRAKHHLWFALISSLDKNEDNYYLIGKNSSISFNENGTLYCFANDVKGF